MSESALIMLKSAMDAFASGLCIVAVIMVAGVAIYWITDEVIKRKKKKAKDAEKERKLKAIEDGTVKECSDCKFSEMKYSYSLYCAHKLSHKLAAEYERDNGRCGFWGKWWTAKETGENK